MGAPVVTANFMKTLADKVREVAVAELFGGIDNSMIREKLALDYTVPITWAIQDQEYPMNVVVYISCLNWPHDTYIRKIIKASGNFQGQTIHSGPAQWASLAEQFAYQLVRKLRAEIENQANPHYLRLEPRTGLNPHMRRIMIE
jgi:hypothetical protein